MDSIKSQWDSPRWSMEGQDERPSLGAESRRKARNRLSLNLNIDRSLPFDFDEKDRIHTPSSLKTYQSPPTIESLDFRPADRPRSFHAVMEEGRLLQEKLAELARTENARLYSTPPPSKISSEISSGNSTLEDLDIPTGVSPTASACLSGPMSPNLKSARRSLQPSPEIKRQGSHKKSHKRQSQSFFVMSPDDLEKRLVSPPQPTTHKRGPSRPHNISGTALSWQMTSELIQLGMTRPAPRNDSDTADTDKDTQALAPVPGSESGAEMLQFLWATLSRPENVLETMRASERRLIPPREVIDPIRRTLPSLRSILEAIVQCVCAGVSASVLVVQIALIGIMVFAYVVGDIIVPRKTITSIINGNNSKSAAIARKIRRSQSRRQGTTKQN